MGRVQRGGALWGECEEVGYCKGVGHYEVCEKWVCNVN